MRTILYIVQKEFLQVFRNKSMLPIIFIIPIVQLIILVNAANLEMKHINIFVVDKDLSTTSRGLISKFQGAPFFNIVNNSTSLKEAENELAKNKADLIIHIPENFDRDLRRENHAKIQLLINAINGTVAGISNAYANSIVAGYNMQIIVEQMNIGSTLNNQINVNYSYIYWDAAIPNNLITVPKEGYSVAYSGLSEFLTTLLPRLGLNRQEAKDFIDYWTAQLPKSNYYFIGIIPQMQINTLAPLIINPKPDSILRVTLFFKPLEEDKFVTAPKIESFNRHGFSVIEWGGLFDTQKHPGFSFGA